MHPSRTFLHLATVFSRLLGLLAAVSVLLKHVGAATITTTPLFIVTTLVPPSQNATSSLTQSPLTSSPSPPPTSPTPLPSPSSVPLPTTTTSTTVGPDFNRCLPINKSSTTLKLNSSDTRMGSVVKASCTPPHYLNSRIDDPIYTGIFTCEGGVWQPVSPKCLVDPPSSKTGIVVACVIGILIGISLLAGGIFLVIKMTKHRELLKQKQEEAQTKMFRINDFVISSNEDFIGMPVVSVKNRNADLRGVPETDYGPESDLSPLLPSPPVDTGDTLHLF